MNVIELPSEEETQVAIKVGDKQVKIDIFDHQEIVQEAFKQMKVLGDSSNKVFSELIKDIYNTRFGTALSVTTAMVLIAKMEEIEEVLKKKFSSLREPSDTITSITNPEPIENSESSTMPESV